ncbi:MAG: arginine decarboxylase, pyruvoyl-dependent [Pseudomonadota bacterium]
MPYKPKHGRESGRLDKVWLVPQKVFFTKGIGRHKAKLQSFELALRDAGIEKCNLVYVSSIFPPNGKLIPFDDGIKELLPGQITYCVLAKISSNEPERLMGASIGLAVPADECHYGYLSEHSAFGESEKVMSDFAEDLASTMLATTLGIDFDPQKDYDERREIYRMSGKIVDTFSTTCVTRGNGLWTTVIAAAIFLL